MGTFSSIEDAREFYKKDRFCTGNGMVIDELGEDSCVCSMEINDSFKNATGTIMGGVIFSLADFAFAVASNQVHMVTVAQQVSINYLNSSKGTRLIASAKCKRNGRTTCVYNVDVIDDLGREIAQFVGTGYKILS